MPSIVQVRLGSVSMFEQSSLTVMPAIRGSTMLLGPTITEVPESMTALKPSEGILVSP